MSPSSSLMVLLLLTLTSSSSARPSGPELSMTQLRDAMALAVSPFSTTAMRHVNVTATFAANLLSDVTEISTLLEESCDSLKETLGELQVTTTRHFSSARSIGDKFRQMFSQMNQLENSCPANRFQVHHDSNDDHQSMPASKPYSQIAQPAEEAMSPEFISEPIFDSRVKASLEAPTQNYQVAKNNALAHFGQNAYVSLKNLMVASNVIAEMVEAKKNEAMSRKMEAYRLAATSMKEGIQYGGEIKRGVLQLSQFVNNFHVETMLGLKEGISQVGQAFNGVDCV